MKRLLVLFLLLLAACSGLTIEEGETSFDGEWVSIGGSTWYREVEMPNGRVIPCLVWTGYKSAGMSCDWSDR